MTALAVILAVFLVAMIVDRVMLTDRVHKLEMKLRNEHYKEGLIMNGAEQLAYGALFILAVALLLTNQVALATVAIVPYVLASFKYSFPTKKAQRHR